MNLKIHDYVIGFLSDRGWESVDKTNAYEYLSSPDDDEVILRVPIDDGYLDYVAVMRNVLDILKELYPKSYNHPKSRLKKLFEKTHNIRHKYSTIKDDWIIPEEESRGKTIDINEIYIPLKP